MRILIADDEQDLVDALAAFVRERGHQVVATVTTGGLDVIHAYARFQPDLVLMDIMMPKYNGLTACLALRSTHPGAKVVFVSGKFNAEHPFVSNTGAVGFLAKPFDFSKLDAILESQAAHTHTHAAEAA